MKNPVDEYLQNLRSFLSAVLEEEDLEESLAETAGHLNERIEELTTTGIQRFEAEQKAIEEFGPVGEIAAALIKGYPPKNPFNLKKFRWIPEIFLGFSVGIIVLMAVQPFVVPFAPERPEFAFMKYMGLQSAAMMLMLTSLSCQIPPFFASVTRLTYRRMRPIAFQSRLATYGLILAVSGTALEVWLQLNGHESSTESITSMQYVAVLLTLVAYGVTRVLNSNGKMFQAVYQRIGRR